MEKTLRGLSFPFRLGNKGGIVMSEVNSADTSHIEESIEQILCTNFGERCMSYEYGANLEELIFNPQDVSLMALLKYQIKDTLQKYEPRIDVQENNITVISNKGSIEVEIKYTLVNHPNMGLLKTLISLGGVEFES